MSQQDTSSSRNLIIGIIAIILVMTAVFSIVFKMVGLELGSAPTTSTEPVAEATSTYTSEELAAGKKLGEKVYNMACIACHTPGMAGAPKLGDSASWMARIKKGEATLIDNAINGFNGMPPRGGRNELSDEDVEWAVRYMLDAI